MDKMDVMEDSAPLNRIVVLGCIVTSDTAIPGAV
jgi:hypothetical protein